MTGNRKGESRLRSQKRRDLGRVNYYLVTIVSCMVLLFGDTCSVSEDNPRCSATLELNQSCKLTSTYQLVPFISFLFRFFYCTFQLLYFTYRLHKKLKYLIKAIALNYQLSRTKGCCCNKSEKM